MANETATETDNAKTAAGLRDRISRLLQWAGASKLRMGLAGVLFTILFSSVFATWSYLAHLAVDVHDEKTLEMALQALDESRFEEAKAIVGEMQQQAEMTPEFGGALFVLGAVKAAQAELEWSQDRQRAMHLIAARYLQKARELGIPPGRENQAEFLVGQSLVLGNQPQAGIEVLESAISLEGLPTTQIHALLTEAYQSIAEPNLPAALKHSEAVLKDANLDPQQSDLARVTQAEILVQLGQLDAARKQIQMVGRGNAQQARIRNVAGRIAIARAERAPPGSDRRTTHADQAIMDFREAQRLDPLSSELTRQVMYWIGKCYELKGDEASAIEHYDQLGKSYGDSSESIAAMLAKADLVRKAGDTQQALAGYRAVLNAAGDPVTYANRLLPISALRKRMLQAYSEFIAARNFEEAMALVDAMQSVFDLQGVTELRAQAHEEWGKSKFNDAGLAKHWEAEQELVEGRYHFRAAGTAYELLSKLRFATREYTKDLWRSAANYFRGQSYTHAERILTEYLHQEALDKQALALLRLGQSRLAQGENDSAIESLEECIEMHPGDAVVYQARLDCAQALLLEDQGERARELLLNNLVGGGLEPTAPEWRDSLFLLGEYLHNSQQYHEAIEKLDEAVRRYPNAKQAVLARYMIARSYHSSAELPARIAQEAKTESERIKNRKLRDQNLTAALKNYLLVQRKLTLQGHVDSNELERLLLRNCYMMQGSVLYQLKRYEEARKAYANISTLYQSEPFVLESFVHIANCYRQLNKPLKAKGTIEQAKLVLNRLPADTDFKLATNFSRQSWELLLNEMGEW